MLKTVVLISTLVFCGELAARTDVKAQLAKLASDRWSWVNQALQFKAPQVSSVTQRQKTLKQHRSKFKQFVKGFSMSASVVRGEIDDEVLLSHLDNWWMLTQYFSESSALSLGKPYRTDVHSALEGWSRYWAELPYEEASSRGLKLTAKYRAQLWQVIDQLLESSPEQAIALNGVLLKMKTPWPVDRVVFFEARKTLAPELSAVFEKAAKSLQSNPYLTLQEAVTKWTPLSQLTAAQIQLFSAWGESDIKMMRQDITAFQKLTLKSAQLAFRQKNGRIPTSVDQLMRSGFLKRAPLDYTTGQPLSL